MSNKQKSNKEYV